IARSHGGVIGGTIGIERIYNVLNGMHSGIKRCARKRTSGKIKGEDAVAAKVNTEIGINSYGCLDKLRLEGGVDIGALLGVAIQKGQPVHGAVKAVAHAQRQIAIQSKNGRAVL